MNEELIELIKSMKTVLDELVKENESLKTRQNDIESLLYDQILNPSKAAIDDYEYNQGLGEFTEKYKDKFDPYLEATKAVEGDDFDLIKNTYDGFKAYEPEEGEEMPGEEAYVDAMIEKVKSMIEAIRNKLDAKEVDLSVDEDGNTELKADGETVTEEVIEEAEEKVEESEGEEEKADEEEKKEDEPTEDKTDVEDEVESLIFDEQTEEGEDNPEDLEAFTKELEESLKMFK